MIPGIVAGISERELDVPLPVLTSSANITHWFRADKAAFSDSGTTKAKNGANVQHWGNQGTAVDHAIQNTLANRPIYRTGGLGGMPYLECPRGDARFFGNLAITYGGGLTSTPGYRTFAFVVDAYDSTRTYNPLIGGTGGKLDVYLRPSSDLVRFYKSQVVFSPSAKPMIVIISAASNTSFRIMINGQYKSMNQSSNASSASYSSLQFLRSSWSSLSPDNYFDGHIYEAIFWNGVSFSSANMTQVSNELNAIYGIY